MIVFKFKLTKKSISWFEENKVDLNAMEAALSLLFAELEPTISTRRKVLTLQIMHDADFSDYTFRTDKIRLCGNPTKSNRPSYIQRKRAFFNHFLHEFRHWMQSRVYKLGTTMINYTDDDVERNTNAYYRNECEVDARQFERAYAAKFYKYYRAFKRTP
jgi:hypothetical protein